ncbi:DExD/H-box ATP-dependent RNA helicase dhh1 [Allomyces javanicus]|nr:DExD/H-box ATP-dependent RNA helicase dhh1 [Allomyces javanicus]
MGQGPSALAPAPARVCVHLSPHKLRGKQLDTAPIRIALQNGSAHKWTLFKELLPRFYDAKVTLRLQVDVKLLLGGITDQFVHKDVEKDWLDAERDTLELQQQLLDAMIKSRDSAASLKWNLQSEDDDDLKHEPLMGIFEAGFERPSPIQKEAIPIALAGRGILVMVTTGRAGFQNVDMVHLLVGTPGRRLDLASNGFAQLEECMTIVMDVTDTLLSPEFQPVIKQLLEYSPEGRQVMLFLATFLVLVKDFRDKWLNAPCEINLMDDLTLKGVMQYYSFAEERHKMHCLNTLFSKLQINQSVVFCNSTSRVELLYAHMPQTHFSRTVNIVVNFDFSKSATTYPHRIGRSGRFGHFGARHQPDDDHRQGPSNFYQIVAVLGTEIHPIPPTVDKDLYVTPRRARDCTRVGHRQHHRQMRKEQAVHCGHRHWQNPRRAAGNAAIKTKCQNLMLVCRNAVTSLVSKLVVPNFPLRAPDLDPDMDESRRMVLALLDLALGEAEEPDRCVVVEDAKVTASKYLSEEVERAQRRARGHGSRQAFVSTKVLRVAAAESLPEMCVAVEGLRKTYESLVRTNREREKQVKREFAFVGTRPVVPLDTSLQLFQNCARANDAPRLTHWTRPRECGTAAGFRRYLLNDLRFKKMEMEVGVNRTRGMSALAAK